MSKCKICGVQAPGRKRRCQSWMPWSIFREQHERHLASEAWKAMRERIMARSGGKCERCDGYAEDVHHLNYCRLGSELDSDLQALCHRCHVVVHQLAKAGMPVPAKAFGWLP